MGRWGGWGWVVGLAENKATQPSLAGALAELGNMTLYLLNICLITLSRSKDQDNTLNYGHFFENVTFCVFWFDQCQKYEIDCFQS